jgi:hypothetical protein
MEAENRELRHALALALGEQRADELLPGRTRDTPDRGPPQELTDTKPALRV